MKRLLSIFLILLIAFNAGGNLFVYFQVGNYFKQIAFNKINYYIPVENLELIRINVKSADYYNADVFERINENEISYYGRMYDIYKEDFSGDTLFIYCLSDEKEDIINNAIFTYINDKKHDNSKSPLANIIKIFITIALVPVENNYCNINNYKKISYLYQITYQNIFLKVPYPPPKVS